jgi:GTPase
VGDYPFTTLKPQLGVVSQKGQELVMADIPGLIKGAAAGVGIGDRFLGHIERCRVLVHLVDGTLESPTQSYRDVRRELALYGAGLEDKHEIVALNKVDQLDAKTRTRRVQALSRAIGKPVYPISGAARTGVGALLDQLLEAVQPAPIVEEAAAEGAVVEEAAAWSPL